MSLTTLDGNVLNETSTSGFNYPNGAQVVPILGDGTTPSGNAVLQQSALTLRQNTITFIAYDATERATYQALYESRAAVDYVDGDGNTTSVRILDFSTALAGADSWRFCSATLIEAG